MNLEVYEFMTMNSWFQIYEFIYYEFIGHYEFIVYEFIVYEFIAMNSYTSEFIYEFRLVNDPDGLRLLSLPVSAVESFLVAKVSIAEHREASY